MSFAFVRVTVFKSEDFFTNLPVPHPPLIVYSDFLIRKY